MAVNGDCPPDHDKDNDGLGCWPNGPATDDIPKCGDHEFYVRSSGGGISCQYDWETEIQCRNEANPWWKPDETTVSGGLPIDVNNKVEARWKTDLNKLDLEFKRCMDENKIIH